MSKTPNSKLSRIFACPSCGGKVRIPLIWIAGVESIIPCRGCPARFRTGYKTGAVLFALGFTLAVATVNILCYLLGSRSMMVMMAAVLPLWIFYGYVLRRAWLLRKARKQFSGK